MLSFLEPFHLEAYANACAEKCGVTVRWDEPGSVPRTNGKIIYLPTLTNTATQEDVEDLLFFLKHEVSHIEYTDFEWWNTQSMKGILGFVCNLLDDNRIDYLNDSKYNGDRQRQNLHAERYAKKITAVITKGDKAKLKIAPLFMWDADCRPLHPNYSYVSDAFKGITDKGVWEQYAKLEKYSDRLAELRTLPNGGNEPLLSLARDICNELFPQEKEEKEELKQQEEVSEDDVKEGGKTEEEGACIVPASDSVDRLIDVLAEEVMKQLQGEDHLKAHRTGMHLIHRIESGGWIMPTKDDYVVTKTWPTTTPAYTYFNKINVQSFITSNAKPLASKLRHHLLIQSKGRYEYGTKTGKLHTGSLHRLISAKGTEQEKRVFRKHHTSDVLDSAISLLVDCSGSMSGSKFEMACAGAAAMAEALKPLHIPFTILGFTCDHSDRNLIHIFNAWGENVTAVNLLHRFEVASSMLYDNADGDAIMWASRDLQCRQEKRKILIVLSDGSPSGRLASGNLTGHTKNVISEIESKKLHEIYGVGIMDNNVKMYYTNNCVISTSDDIASSILSIIKRSV